MGYNDRVASFWSTIHRTQQAQFQRNRAQQIASSVGDRGASAMVDIARAYPHMSPGVIRALGQSGADPDNPMVVYAAYMEAARQGVSAQGFNRAYGDAIDFSGFSGRLKEFALSQQDPRVSGALTQMGYDSESPRVQAGQAAETRRFREENDPSYLQGVTGRGREFAYEGQRSKQRAAAARMGYGARSFEDMSTDELVPYLTDVELLKNPLGGEGETMSDDRARDLLENDREKALEIIRRSMATKRSILSRSPADILTGAVSGPASAADRQLSSIPGISNAYDALKGTVRTATMAASYPLQEANSIVRNIYGMATGKIDPFAPASEQEAYVNIGEGTDIGIAAEQGFRNVDTGQGWFVDPDSEVARIQRERAVLSGTIGGHAPTIGRIFANTFTEPDSEPFDFISGLVDATVSWYGDPVGAIPIGTATRTRRLFQMGNLDEAHEAAGLVNGVRKYVNPQRFDEWVTQRPGTVSFFRETKDPYEIDKSVNFAMGPDVATRLARANSDDQVVSAMRGFVNRGKIRQTTQFTGSTPYRLRYNTQQAFRAINPSWGGTNRLTQRLPGQFLDINDKSQVVEQARRILHNANAPEDMIRDAYNSIARASTPAGVLTAAHHMVDDVRDVLSAHGVKDEQLQETLIRLRDTRHREDVQGLVEGIGADSPNIDAIIVRGVPQPIGSIHHSLQALTQYWEIGGDARAIRRVTSSMPFLNSRYRLQPIQKVIERNGGLPTSLTENVMSFLKASWLLRPAWPVRFLAEEQVRIANSPLDTASFFDHPLKALAIHTGKSHGLDPLGRPIDQLEELTRAQVHGHGDWIRQERAVPRGHPQVYAKWNPAHRKDFDYNWANHLARTYQHPVAQHLLQNSRDETIEWLLRGQGKSLLADQRSLYGGLENRNQIGAWLDTLTDNVRQLTNNDTDLITALRQGNYQGVPIYLDDDTINPGFRRIVAAHHDINAPEYIDGMRFTIQKEQYNGVMDRIWGALFSYPANRFSREPHFKQALWAHTREMIGGATRTAQKRILANAREAGIKGEEYRRLVEAASAARGRLSAEEITNLAKGYALDSTKELLYDLTERRQWADVMRVIVPFGDAYQEIIQSWSRLVTQQRGKPIYRLSQIVNAAREPGSGNVLGTGVQGGGFFWEDEYGTEMFNYPLSAEITSFLTGVKTPLSGRVQGLNMVGNFIPGLGPVAQLPAAYFIDKYSNLEGFRDILVPFGAPGSGENELLNPLNYGPAYLRKAVQAATTGGINQRLYNNQVMASYAYLISTGEYGQTPEELQRAMEDATAATWKLHAITAIGSWVLPSSPSPQELIQDDSGTLLSIAAISKDYWERVDETSYDEANAWFLSNFGEDAIGAIVPRTVTTAVGVPRTIAQGEWWKAHPELADQFPQTYGLFGPQGGEFDYGVYIESILSGQREGLSPQQFLRVMNDWMGNYWYSRVREDTGGDQPTDEQRSIRTAAAQQISEDYPYWDGKPGMAGLPAKAEPEDLIEEMQRALSHDEIRNTDVGQALTFYLEAREMAEQEVVSYNEEFGTDYKSFREANDLVYIRDWLRGVASDIIEDYPAFENTWDIVLNRELSEDAFLRQ